MVSPIFFDREFPWTVRETGHPDFPFDEALGRLHYKNKNIEPFEQVRTKIREFSRELVKE